MLANPRMRNILLWVLASLIVFARLGHGHLANFDDCYYAEKAKEMLRGGDWLTPHFSGNAALDNPPLFFWLVATGFRLFGVTNYGAAFFSALAGVFCVVLVVRIARRLGFDDFEAWSAGVVLVTTQYFLKYAHHAMMDVVLTLFFLLGVDGYLSGAEGRRRGWVQLGVATGLGVLTKSVLGLFPLIVAALHRLTVRRLRAASDPGLWIAAFVAAALASPWFLYQYSVHGDQLVKEHFLWLLWARGFVLPADPGGGNDPFGYLIRIATVYWPWLPLALAGIGLEAARALDRSRESHERSAARLMLLWLVVVLGVMSLGHEKKLWYVMSVFPCLALLAARAIGRLARSDVARRRTVAWTTGVLAVFTALLTLTPIGPARQREPDLQQMALVVRNNVPAGEKIVNLDAKYWDYANQFLFYSNHDLTEPLGDPALVRERLRRGSWALVRTSRVTEIVGSETSAYGVVARSGEWALLRGAPAAVLELQPVTSFE